MAILILIPLAAGFLFFSKWKNQKEDAFPKSYLISMRNRPKSTNTR